ncbi:MAG: ABC transporter permease [Actinobacteria bacterium]|nr:MAG: ABC transporter permease [Actinomycetota bacterium]
MTTQAAGRRKPPGLLKTSAAFFRVDVIEEFNYPLTLVMQLLGIIVPLIPFFFISELVGPNSRTVGGDYMTFVVIGLGMTAVLTGAMSGFGSSLQRAFQRGTMEVFLVEPVPWTTLPLAMNQWTLMFGALSGLLIFGVGSLLGATYDLAGIPLALLIAVLGMISSTAIGICSAAILLLTLKSAPLLRLYSVAASRLAGSIFSVEQLPTWAEYLSYLLPHTYVINATRTLLMDDPGSFVMEPSTAIIALIIFNVVFLFIGFYMFRRALELSRKMGTLGGY